MRTLLLSLLCLFCFSYSGTAQDYIIADDDMSVKNVNFDGNVEQVDIDGLTASLAFNLISTDGTVWLVGFSLENTSSSPIDSSTISRLGMDVDPAAVVAFSVNGSVYDNVDTGSFPNQFGAIDFCVKDGTQGTCSGGLGGLMPGDTDTFTLMFTLGAPSDMLTLSNLGVRYQAIDSEYYRFDDASGTGMVTIIPEVSTWLMMITGFGIVGAFSRRSRRQRYATC